MLNEVNGVPPPPPRRRLIVHRVLTAEKQMFVCVSKNPWGMQVHWYGRRSHECFAPKATCQRCIDGWPWKWQAYFHVLVDAGRTPAFLEVTATCYHLLKAQIPSNTNWRGTVFHLHRTKGGAKGRYIGEVLERRIPDSDLPQELDPIDTLRFLWNVKKHTSTAA